MELRRLSSSRASRFGFVDWLDGVGDGIWEEVDEGEVVEWEEDVSEMSTD
jgi:hypothetical protein